MRRRRVRYLLAAAIVTATLGASGCVYYNTFFNARRSFEQAEKARGDRDQLGAQRQPLDELEEPTDPQSRPVSTLPARITTGSDATMYRTAIEKAGKVLAYYPESQYVDDALLLMAKAYFRLGEYGSSLRKCQELLRTYPNSSFATEASYWRGMSLWKLDRQDEAAPFLREIADRRGSPFRGDAAFALAELEREEGRPELAIEHYRTATASARDPVFRTQAREGLADCLADAGRPEEVVVRAYASIAASARTNRERYVAFVKMARVQRRMRDYRSALATLEPLLVDQHFTDFDQRTRLEMARTYEEEGEVEHALLLYQRLLEEAEALAAARDYPQQQYAGSNAPQVSRRAIGPEEVEAHYRLGLLHERHFHNLAKAAEEYETAAQNTASDAGKAAQGRKGKIDRWAELHRGLADTSAAARTPRAHADALFRLAEHFYFELDDADSALAYFRAVADSFPTNPLHARSRYAIGWLLANARQDSAGADSAWTPLLQDTTRSPEVLELQRAIRKHEGDAPLDPAHEPFSRAEQAWTRALEELPPQPPDTLVDSLACAQWWSGWSAEQRRRSETYVALLEDIVRRFPESPYATRASFILGWTAENVAGDTALAFRWYRRVCADSIVAPDVAAMARDLIALRAGVAQDTVARRERLQPPTASNAAASPGQAMPNVLQGLRGHPGSHRAPGPREAMRDEADAADSTAVPVARGRPRSEGDEDASP